MRNIFYVDANDGSIMGSLSIFQQFLCYLANTSFVICDATPCAVILERDIIRAERVIAKFNIKTAERKERDETTESLKS